MSSIDLVLSAPALSGRGPLHTEHLPHQSSPVPRCKDPAGDRSSSDGDKLAACPELAPEGFMSDDGWAPGSGCRHALICPSLLQYEVSPLLSPSSSALAQTGGVPPRTTRDPLSATAFCIGFKRGHCSFKEIPRLAFVTGGEGGVVAEVGTQKNEIKRSPTKRS